MRKLFTLTLVLFAARLGAGGAGDLDYRDKAQGLRGYLAGSDLPGKRPGVLIVHQWMGLTDYEQGRARQLAELGYVALAADIYGAGVRAKDGKEAAALANKYKADRVLFRRRLQAGLDALKGMGNVDPKRLAVMGYCFGGTGALEAARAGMKIRGAISFHGSLDTPSPAKPGDIRCPVLVLHGAEDPWANGEQVRAFEDEMRAAKADWQVVLYSGAVHAFTQKGAGDDPSKGAAYDEKADKRSWAAMKAFLEEIFAK